MAKNDIRARLLKQRGTLASETVKLSFGEVEMREIKSERLDVIREIAKRKTDSDGMTYARLCLAESIYVDNELLINQELMEEAKEYEADVLIEELFKYGDVLKAYSVFERLIGMVVDEEEVETLKN